ncbi:OLC1v1026864C1 [Oldenlandia corymbosa var. corymbosa]|uniref:OLC1v1026864C1 n=1 Tax=Oldenlandia corymbosa var. corymbosa TaxID=529605 RepID=A0AAV1CBC0_OLDCO|nr:OLC1v1026864C1 [Oldenlandia corymbosa var. corymbosa]
MASSDEDSTGQLKDDIPEPSTPTPTKPGDEIDDEEINGVEDEDDGGEEDDDEVEPPHVTRQSRMQSERAKMETLFHRLARERVPVRVHDVLIKGNSKTKDYIIEAQLEALKRATTMQELLQAASVANAQLQGLEIFDSVNITLDSGPPELPGTANVIVEVVEAKRFYGGDCGVYTNAETRSWSLEGSLKLKNLLGYGDIWDGSLAYGWDQSSEISAALYLPRNKGLMNPVVARISLLSQDWLKFSSYKERALGFSLGLISTRNHDLSYNLSWRTLSDPSQLSSSTVRRQLGHGLLSALKYTYKIDHRNSSFRPTQGYAFVSTSQLGGLYPDSRSLRFIRQEFDFRYALPLGFYNMALNFGISSGVVFPWGNGSLNRTSTLTERFFLGGNMSPFCTLGGPASVLGFKTRGLGPAEPRRQGGEGDAPSEMDFLGGDLAVTAFADLSFDLPLKILRDAGIHGHAFASTGSLTSFAENSYRNFSFSKFKESFRSSVGVGLIVPTKLFRLEINYCHILKKMDHDRGRTGVQFSFSSPS